MNTVPPYHTLMLPLLKVMGTRNEMTTKQMRDEVAENLGLSVEALSERLPSGTQNAFDNRMGWARTYLFKAGLIERPRRATYAISETGKKLLANPPSEINVDFLRSYEQFNQFFDASKSDKVSLASTDVIDAELTPEEQIEKASGRFSVSSKTKF